MITVSDAVRALIDDGGFVYSVKVSSWLIDSLLADDVPIAAATEDCDATLAVPERVVFTVPRLENGVDWTPYGDEHPLASNGQVLKVSLGVDVGNGVTEWFQRGEYLIVSSEENENDVTVTCAGLLYLINEARFVGPFQPSGTIVSTLRALLEPALTVDVDSAPTDRAVPAGINWDGGRLDAVGELLDAWPATLTVNPLGYAEVLPDVAPSESVRSFTNQVGGTIITASGKSSRDGAFNVVVATGYAADGGEVRGLAYVESGPWQYETGQANPLSVPYLYSSPLLTTNTQCTAAARTVLRRKMRQAVLQAYEIVCPPDPTLQLGDAVSVTTDHVSGLLCTVESFVLPYVPASMTVRVVSVA